MLALSGGYTGGKRGRKNLKNWVTTIAADADADIIPDLAHLRDRSRDLVRNNSLVAGAMNTKVTSIVGPGLRLHSEIDHKFLNMSREQAEVWQANAEREFNYWASQKIDIERRNNFGGCQALVLRSTLEAGDTFAVRRFKKLGINPYGLRIQLIEADRVCNKDHAADTPNLVQGVVKNNDGMVTGYQIANGHPGRYGISKELKWVEPSAWDEATGLQNVLHINRQTRIHQTRGVPELAPVIELIKQLGTYKQAEVDAAVVTAMLTVFIKSDIGAADIELEPDEGGAKDEDISLGTGTVVGLAPGEDITTASPNRPNVAFDGFVQSLTKEIGMAVELPYEVLTKHFAASYSAAQAALLEAWRYFKTMRQWLVDDFCDPVYQMFLYEAVATGRIAAPGFFKDPIVRAAYCGARWVGPPKGHVNELVSINAATKRIDAEVSTRKQEAAEFGSDYDRNHVQRSHEEKQRRENGTHPKTPVAAIPEQPLEVKETDG